MNPNRSILAPALAGSLLVTLFAGPALAEEEWLAISAKGYNPVVYSKSGIGTAKAVAKARITKKAIEEWCENWSPQSKTCVAEAIAEEDLSKEYSATADCTAGRITTVSGDSYTLAGSWDDSDIGGGRSKWRDKAGAVVGRDNASGGLGISEQWELLCPVKATPGKEKTKK